MPKPSNALLLAAVIGLALPANVLSAQDTPSVEPGPSSDLSEVERTPAFRVRLETFREGTALRLTGVQVPAGKDAGAKLRFVAASDLIQPMVLDFALAASGNPILFGVPPGRTPPRRGRAALVTDLVLNSGLFNIADDREGLVLRFEPALINGPGPDLLLAELGAAVGAESAASPGVPAPGGDQFHVLARGESDETFGLVVQPKAYASQGLLTPISNYAKADTSPLASLMALDSADASLRATVGYLHLYAVALDLSDMGVPQGDGVSIVALRSLPLTAEGGRSDYAAGGRYFYLDPVLVLGLPAFEPQ